METFKRAEQPPDGDERSVVLGWLAFHRDALAAKCHGLTNEQLVERSATPSALSLLGIVRRMAEMERVYGVWALGPKADLEWVWGTYDYGAEHDIDCDASTVQESLRVWREEMRKTDQALANQPTVDGLGAGNGRSVRWNLAKRLWASTRGTTGTQICYVSGSTGKPESEKVGGQRATFGMTVSRSRCSRPWPTFPNDTPPTAGQPNEKFGVPHFACASTQRGTPPRATSRECATPG